MNSPLTPTDIQKIHEATLTLLDRTGVAFHSPMAIEIFARHWFRTKGPIVHFPAKEVEGAIENAPGHFNLLGRNPERTLTVGKGDIAFAPGYGAPYLMTEEGRRRKTTLEDYIRFCKLGHTSDVINVTGFLTVDASDLPPESYHLDMLFQNLTLSDQPFMGSPLSAGAARDAVEMATMVFGSQGLPVMVSLINSLQPLQFSREMTESLITFCRHNQPVIIMGGGIMGATAPLRLPGLLCVQNAVVLAGLTLSQLVHPGCPVLYGVGGSPMDMKSGAYTIGGPELSRSMRAGVALAKRYGLPCRGGGALTDSHEVDFQAGAQSAFLIGEALSAGVDFIVHGCGILGSYMAMSFEKFVADEDLCRHALFLRRPLDLSDLEVEVKAIEEVGTAGHYLTQERTVKFCRTEFFRSPLMNRSSYENWEKSRPRIFTEKATALVEERLRDYKQPSIGEDLVRDLSRYVQMRKEEIGRQNNQWSMTNGQ